MSKTWEHNQVATNCRSCKANFYRDKTEASLQKLRPNILRQVFQAKGKDADVKEAGEGLRPVLLGPAPWHAGGARVAVVAVVVVVVGVVECSAYCIQWCGKSQCAVFVFFK